MITAAEILMGRDGEFPLTAAFQANLDQLVHALNLVRTAYGQPMYVTSGYRPGRYNKAAGGAKASAHLTCQACDFADGDGKLAAWILSNLVILERAGLWLENPAKTKGWIHLQSRTVGSRVFNP